VLAYQKDAEEVKFGRHTQACIFTPVDHAQIARACGCRGVSIRNANDYLPALREALACNETTVLDVDTDPNAYPPITVFDDKLDAFRAERNSKNYDAPTAAIRQPPRPVNEQRGPDRSATR